MVPAWPRSGALAMAQVEWLSSGPGLEGSHMVQLWGFSHGPGLVAQLWSRFGEERAEFLSDLSHVALAADFKLHQHWFSLLLQLRKYYPAGYGCSEQCRKLWGRKR